MSTDELLTLTEAAEYVKVGCSKSLRRWALKNNVRPVRKGRYARVHLDNGIRREIRNAK